MNDSCGFARPNGSGAGDDLERARRLRQQADWCVSMAAKVIDPRMFRTYVDAAASYQERARVIEDGATGDGAIEGGARGAKDPA